MKRRRFTKLAGLGAVAVSTTGLIRFNGTSFVGDCKTTTDILGPFYRPDSPVRNNLVIKGLPGEIIELSGVVRHKDCQTPYENAKVELWHCSAEQIYDNETEEFRYRGTTYCDKDGGYKFTTQMPVPYEVGVGLTRPAHFHLMFSAPGYQSLITQIYFQGDPYLAGDTSSAAPDAASRILKVKEVNSVKQVVFDCTMSERLKASNTALQQIVGRYKNDKNGEVKEFFQSDGLLWLKNEVFGESYEYLGNNQFEYPGTPPGSYERLKFKLKKDGTVQLKFSALRGKGNKIRETYTKV